MRNTTLNIFILLIICGCQSGNEKADKVRVIDDNIELVAFKNQEVEADDFDFDKHLENYQSLKARIAKDRDKLANREDVDQESKIELAENYMSKMLVDSIFRYWLGTKWDFNGYTEKPRVGVVACGYFVSTTLRDLGIKLNRFKVAQKGASDIISTLCDQESIEQIFSMEDLSQFLADTEEDDILVVVWIFMLVFYIGRMVRATLLIQII